MSANVVSIACPHCHGSYSKWSCEADLCPRCTARDNVVPFASAILADAPSLPPPIRQALLVAVDVSDSVDQVRRGRVVDALSSALETLRGQVGRGVVDLSVFAFTSDALRLWPPPKAPPYGDIADFADLAGRLPRRAWQPGSSMFELMQKVARNYTSVALDAGRPLTVMVFTDGNMDTPDELLQFIRDIRTARATHPAANLPVWKQPAARVFGIAPDDACRPAVCRLFTDEFVRVADPTDASRLTRLLIAVTQNALAA